ncbi:MAG: response regulator, partial [Chloroflexi bacterium]|nr:response regulator [Chloroflexota bacterium]
LKGAAASIGFKRVAHFAHLMEDLFEHYLSNGSSLSEGAITTLRDGAYLVEDLLQPTLSDEVEERARSVDRALRGLIGPMQPAEIIAPGEASGPVSSASGPATQDLLRLPQSDIDQLINHVGEIVINRASLERHVTGLSEMLSELDLSTRRLKRAVRSIETRLMPSQPTGSQQAVAHRAPYADFDPLEMDRYSVIYEVSRELEELAADNTDIASKLHYLTDEIDASLLRERRLTTDLQRDLIATRLVSFAELETRLRRIVHRTAQDLDKSATLEIDGLDTQIDKTIRDALLEPLTHLLRNAVDHGLEPAARRDELGKNPQGTIHLTFTRERGRVVIRLTDDGRGVDLAAIQQKAEALGLIKDGKLSSQQDLLGLLFKESFSTAEVVTETSGRGLGLAIVQRALSELKGTIRVSSETGKGTMFTLSVPVTLAITRALYVRCAGQLLAVPLDQVLSVIRITAAELERIHRDNTFRFEGRLLGVQDLRSFLGSGRLANEQAYGLVIDIDAQAEMILVDGLAGIHDVVVKPLGNHLKRVHGVIGGTISGEGRVILILDINEILGGQSIVSVDQQSQSSALTAVTSRPQPLRVLVVDDSVSVRRVIGSVLERYGWNIDSAKDGIEALEQLNQARPDVVLLDIEMPRMNGYELLSRIRANPQFHDLPVVFLTSRAARKHRDRADQLNAQGYLVKPYSEGELIDTLQQAVSGP